MIFIFKWIPSNNSVTNLFLILQNYLRPFQTWRHPSSPNHCKPLSQSECRHHKKSCHLLDKKGTHPMRIHDNNTICNRSNQNASLPDTHPLNQSASSHSRHNKNHMLLKCSTMLKSIPCCRQSSVHSSANYIHSSIKQSVLISQFTIIHIQIFSYIPLSLAVELSVFL